ncbi:MAG: hypothetical protein IJO73_02315 [Clostridia bacterium]|nr:hypothetical protein [Clostridia bacterium]
MKNIDLTPIFQALILLISSVITIYILPKVKTFLTAKLSAEQRENLKQWVKVAVAAAEQVIKGSGKGKEKKQYVLDFLLSKGITFDTDEVTALIESEVYKLTQGSGYFVAVPEGDTETKVCDYGTYLDEYCGDGNCPTEDTEPSVPDEETESDEADEEYESDTTEADDLFSMRNTCK